MKMPVLKTVLKPVKISFFKMHRSLAVFVIQSLLSLVGAGLLMYASVSAAKSVFGGGFGIFNLILFALAFLVIYVTSMFSIAFTFLYIRNVLLKRGGVVSAFKETLRNPLMFLLKLPLALILTSIVLFVTSTIAYFVGGWIFSELLLPLVMRAGFELMIITYVLVTVILIPLLTVVPLTVLGVYWAPLVAVLDRAWPIKAFVNPFNKFKNNRPRVLIISALSYVVSMVAITASAILPILIFGIDRIVKFSFFGGMKFNIEDALVPIFISGALLILFAIPLSLFIYVYMYVIGEDGKDKQTPKDNDAEPIDLEPLKKVYNSALSQIKKFAIFAKTKIKSIPPQKLKMAGAGLLVVFVASYAISSINYSVKKSNALSDENLNRFAQMFSGPNSAGIDEYAKEHHIIVDALIDYAKDTDLDSPEEVRNLVAKYDKYKDAASPVFGICEDDMGEFDDYGYDDYTVRETGQLCEDFNDLHTTVHIRRTTDSIPAKYDEQESKTIPIGYTIIKEDPEDGEIEFAEVSVDGKQMKDSVHLSEKPPKNGIKLVGTGTVEDIMPALKQELNKLFDMWNNQTFTAQNILPFLIEEEKERALDLERRYKSIVLNWKRFSDIKVVADDTYFEKIRNDDYPIAAYITLKNNSDRISLSRNKEINLFYSAKEGKWIVAKDTLDDLFSYADRQKIYAEVTPKEVYPIETDSCSGKYSKKIDEVYLRDSNYLRLPYKMNLDIGGFALNTGSTNLEKDLISHINKNKISKFTIKVVHTGFWSDCEARPNGKIEF